MARSDGRANRSRPAQPSSAATPATRLLAERGVPHELRPFATGGEPGPDAPTGYGHVAADALGVEPQRVFKTLVVDLDGTLVVAAVPVDATVDLKAVAAALDGKKAAMADPADAERATGYVIGGISPLGQRRTHRTVVDASATSHRTILVSGGRRGLDVELAPTDLVELTAAVLADIARR